MITANIFPRLNKQIVDLKYTIPLTRYAKLPAGTHAMKRLYRTVYTHTRENNNSTPKSFHKL